MPRFKHGGRKIAADLGSHSFFWGSCTHCLAIGRNPNRSINPTSAKLISLAVLAGNLDAKNRSVIRGLNIFRHCFPAKDPLEIIVPNRQVTRARTSRSTRPLGFPAFRASCRVVMPLESTIVTGFHRGRCSLALALGISTTSACMALFMSAWIALSADRFSLYW